jgi:hypothetical protein
MSMTGENIMQTRTGICIAVGVTLQALGGPAAAQTITGAAAPGESPQRVEVTGSRIRQVDLETAQPVQVMTQEQIRRPASSPSATSSTTCPPPARRLFRAARH